MQPHPLPPYTAADPERYGEAMRRPKTLLLNTVVEGVTPVAVIRLTRFS